MFLSLTWSAQDKSSMAPDAIPCSGTESALVYEAEVLRLAESRAAGSDADDYCDVDGLPAVEEDPEITSLSSAQA